MSLAERVVSHRSLATFIPKFKTPANALILNMILGIIALLTGKTGEIITIACFGAILLYIFAMITVLILRKKEPGLARPFRVPMYPGFSRCGSLRLPVVSMVAMITLNIILSIIFFAILALAYIWFHFIVKQKRNA
jgi:ethanolamine permease